MNAEAVDEARQDVGVNAASTAVAGGREKAPIDIEHPAAIPPTECQTPLRRMGS